MSKLNKMKTNADKQGKAVLRNKAREDRWTNTSGKTETRHQHHKPGSMNMKKAGR